MTSKRNIERRLDELADDLGSDGDEDERERVTIRSARVDEDGNPTEVFSKLEIWTDENGEQHSERTTYDEGEGPDVVEATARRRMGAKTDTG